MVGANVVTLNQAVWDSLAEEVTFNQDVREAVQICEVQHGDPQTSGPPNMRGSRW